MRRATRNIAVSGYLSLHVLPDSCQCLLRAHLRVVLEKGEQVVHPVHVVEQVLDRPAVPSKTSASSGESDSLTLWCVLALSTISSVPCGPGIFFSLSPAPSSATPAPPGRLPSGSCRRPLNSPLMRPVLHASDAVRALRQATRTATAKEPELLGNPVSAGQQDQKHDGDAGTYGHRAGNLPDDARASPG